MTSGLALTLVVVVDEARVGAAEHAATRAAAEHPCRLIVVVRQRSQAAESRLDAEVLIGGRLGPGEAVVLRMHGRLAAHAESVVLPLLAPDAPVVTWWYGEPPQLLAHDPLSVLAGRRITDVALAADAAGALRQRAADYAPGDTDLSWTRATPWRALCASALDATDATVRTVRVVGADADPVRMVLAGWLGSRLGVTVELVGEGGEGVREVTFGLSSGEEIGLVRTAPGAVALRHSGRSERELPLPERELGDLLAEELRRLDADQPYAEALEVATGERDLSARPSARTHIWNDPAGSGGAA